LGRNREVIRMKAGWRPAWLVAAMVSVVGYGDVVFDMVTIGHPGNPYDEPFWDNIRYGKVDYVYRISRYEVTVAQYCEFLNQKAKSDPYGLWDPAMADPAYGPGFIFRSGEEGSYSYTVAEGKGDQPVRWVSFFDAVRFVNWLENGQGDGDTEEGSYSLSNGYWLVRNEGAHWVLPSGDEWHKAAYYDGEAGVYHEYPNGKDEVPEEPTDGTTPREMNFGDVPYWEAGPYFTSVGETTGKSAYGVYDMGGNVAEWCDSFLDITQGAWRLVRGGSFLQGEEHLRAAWRDSGHPLSEGDSKGFRVVCLIPEPGVPGLVLLGGGILLGCLRRRRG